MNSLNSFNVLFPLLRGTFILERNGVFLNRAELSLNSGNLKITEAWIGLNLKILSLHVSCWNCGSILFSHTKGGCVAGLSPFNVMAYMFVTEFREFSETFRKNSNIYHPARHILTSCHSGQLVFKKKSTNIERSVKYDVDIMYRCHQSCQISETKRY